MLKAERWGWERRRCRIMVKGRGAPGFKTGFKCGEEQLDTQCWSQDSHLSVFSRSFPLWKQWVTDMSQATEEEEEEEEEHRVWRWLSQHGLVFWVFVIWAHRSGFPSADWNSQKYLKLAVCYQNETWWYRADRRLCSLLCTENDARCHRWSCEITPCLRNQMTHVFYQQYLWTGCRYYYTECKPMAFCFSPTYKTW